MAPLKLYYLSAEVAPFSETYELATFSRKITSKLHDKEDVDIRVSQPKYGYVSERKYILREVIRLKDIPVMFNEEKHIINMKSCFIPETRVQVYFMENNPLYKPLPDLIYKARNGRIFSDIDERFAFFALSAIDTLTSLFWAPDVFICNDWQTSFLPILLREQYKQEEFYSNMKSVYIIHSVNDYRKYSKKTYDMLGLTPGESGKLIDNHICAIENADLTIAMNYESSKLMDKMMKQKKLFDAFESNNSMIIDIPKKSNREVWKETANTIESACKKLK
ncbi:MAG: glycogen/starch synthase [Candidatus Marinimicrobia bacterium]|nr:glycogen/starch synthase [Candidatus Neomarinimicrobiota bacterium]|tara:strand:- start:439 stop:1272 length:834 start_codon:yes stop_codon:yes gene_type:complete